MKRILALVICLFIILGNVVYAQGIDISGGTVTVTPVSPTNNNPDPNNVLPNTGRKIVEIANYFIWFAVALSLIGFAYAAMRLAASAGNPRRKEEAQRGMLVCFICIVLLGSIDLILNIAVGAFN